MADRTPSSRVRERRSGDDRPATADLLSVLADETCRRIVERTADGWHSVDDLVAACEASQSTVYRKVDELADIGVLDESTRIRSSGAHTTVYTCSITDVHVSLDGGELTAECQRSLEADGNAPVGIHGD